MAGTVRIIAHRGASHEQQENTLPAIQAAIDMGADFVEIDVHISQDGVVVCHHDAAIKSGLVISEESFRSLKDAFQELPTLEEILNLPFGTTGLMIELKEGKLPLVPAVLRLLQAGVNMPLILGSFSSAIMRELSAHWPLEKLIGIAETNEELREHEMLGPGYFALSAKLATKETIRRLQTRGAKVWVWTVDDAGIAKAMVQAGVNGIITNEPRAMINSDDFSITKN